jgi:hypothetical protein
VGLSSTELIKHYPSVKLEVSGGIFKEYVDVKKELLFFLLNDIVNRVDISANIDDFINEYSN